MNRMKRIIHVLLLASFGIWLASCEKDTGISVPEARLKVTEASVIFETAGGEGYIKVETPETVTANSNQDWCTVSVTDKTINLNASPNTEMKGRTAVITIQSASESTTVTAVQTSAVMWIKDFANSLLFLSEGSSVKSAVVSSFPVTVKSKPDWIAYSFENDSLYLTASVGGPRKGEIVFSSEGREISFDLLQASYDGFLGEWEMKYLNPSNSNEETTTVTLSENVKNESLTIDGLVISGSNVAKINLLFNPDTNNVTLAAGQYLATIGSNYVYLCLRSPTGQYIYSTDSQLAGIFSISDDGVVTYTFVDNGTWSGNTAGGFGFYVFTGQPPSSATSTGSSYRRFMNVVMTKK